MLQGDVALHPRWGWIFSDHYSLMKILLSALVKEFSNWVIMWLKFWQKSLWVILF